MKIKLIIFKRTVKAQYKNRLAYCGKSNNYCTFYKSRINNYCDFSKNKMNNYFTYSKIKINN